MKIANIKILPLIISILILIILYQTKIIYNVNFIIKNNFDERINKTYGFCSGESIGYLRYLKKRYKFNDNPKIINYTHTPNVSWSIINPKKIKIASEKIILLNYPGKEIKLNYNSPEDNSYNLNNLSFYKDKITSITKLVINLKKPINTNVVELEMYSEIKLGKRKFIQNFKKINIISDHIIEIELNLNIDDIYPRNNNINLKLKNLKKDNIKKVSFIGENKFDISKIKLIDKYNKCFLVEKND